MPADRPRRRWRVVSTVRFRITALAAVAVALVLAAAGIGLVVAQSRLLVENLDESLEERADELAVLYSSGDLPERLATGGDDTVAQIVSDDGAVIAASESIASRPIANDPVGAGPEIRTVDDLAVDDERFRVLSRRIDGPAGPAVVHVAGSLDEVDESTAVLIAVLAVGVPATAIVLAAVVWWLVGRTLRPVEAIRAEVAEIGGAALHRRVPEPRGDDEIARLAATMNAMLDRVEDAAERQRRFVADASHELRSPLTRIRSEVEVDLAHPDAADLEATHRSVLDEAVALQRLVDDLLQLARSDAMASVGRAVDVDLDDVVLRQAENARRVAGVAVDTQGVTAVRVVGDDGQLDRAVGNLVDNATRYARTAVVITLAEHDGHAVLAVTDDGPGIAPTDRERVFERFARLDQARARDEGGSGLGLAIARDIVRRHGGDIAIDPQHQPGSSFVVTLPLSPSER